MAAMSINAVTDAAAVFPDAELCVLGGEEVLVSIGTMELVTLALWVGVILFWVGPTGTVTAWVGSAGSNDEELWVGPAVLGGPGNSQEPSIQSSAVASSRQYPFC